MDFKKVLKNIPGIFGLQMTSVKPLPTPLGIEIDNEGNDIVYLGPGLDKWSMYNDRMRMNNDLKLAITKAKNEQTSNAN